MDNQILLDIHSDAVRELEKALADIPATDVAVQPRGVVNHAAWTLTHLCVANDFLLQLLGESMLCPAGWAEVAKPGTIPQPDASMYPSLAESLTTIHQQRKQIVEAVTRADPETFNQPAPDALRDFAPTLGHIITYLLAVHTHYHLAQIYVWKRAVSHRREATSTVQN